MAVDATGSPTAPKAYRARLAAGGRRPEACQFGAGHQGAYSVAQGARSVRRDERSVRRDERSVGTGARSVELDENWAEEE